MQQGSWLFISSSHDLSWATKFMKRHQLFVSVTTPSVVSSIFCQGRWALPHARERRSSLGQIRGKQRLSTGLRLRLFVRSDYLGWTVGKGSDEDCVLSRTGHSSMLYGFRLIPLIKSPLQQGSTCISVVTWRFFFSTSNSLVWKPF